MSIKLAIFDLAGTTVKHKNEVHLSFIKAFKENGINITYDMANAAMGKPKPIAIGEILSSLRKDEKFEMTQKVHNRFKQLIIEYYENSSELEEKDGTTQLFQFLKQQEIKIGIDTGFDNKTAELIVKRLGWKKEKLIDAVVGSDQVEHGRPAPDLIYAVMKTVGVEDVNNVVKVGDTPVDLLEGSNAKCKYVVGVTDGAFRENELKSYPHTHLVSDIRDLKHIVTATALI